MATRPKRPKRPKPRRPLPDPPTGALAPGGYVDTSARINRDLEMQRDHALARLNRRANSRKTLEVLDQYLLKVEEAVTRLQRVERLVTAVLSAVSQFEEEH